MNNEEVARLSVTRLRNTSALVFPSEESESQKKLDREQWLQDKLTGLA